MSRVKKYKAQKRHIAKAISWRFFGTLGTVVVAWIILGDPIMGLEIGVVELITKTLLYYFHERVWFNIDFPNSHRRHLAKTITWRLVGTIDTMIIAWVISGNPWTGLQVGGVEAVVKMVMYYYHERIWHHYSYGLEPIAQTEKIKSNGDE